MLNTFAFVVSIIFLVVALCIANPDKKSSAEAVGLNAQLAKVWMMASAIVLAMGYFVEK